MDNTQNTHNSHGAFNAYTTAEPDGMMSQAAKMARDVRDGARKVAETHGKEQLGKTAEMAASQVDRATGTVEAVADTLRDQELDSLAGYANGLAGTMQQASDRLRERTGEEIIHDITQLARRNPAVFVIGAAVAGFVAARFIKASAERHADRTAGV